MNELLVAPGFRVDMPDPGKAGLRAINQRSCARVCIAKLARPPLRMFVWQGEGEGEGARARERSTRAQMERERKRKRGGGGRIETCWLFENCVCVKLGTNSQLCEMWPMLSAGDAQLRKGLDIRVGSNIRKGYDLVRVCNVNGVAFFHQRITKCKLVYYY